MFWRYGFSWGGPLLTVLGMALLIVLLVIIVWSLISWLNRKTSASVPQDTGRPVSGPSAMEILRQRYARGEIDTATFEQMRGRLLASSARDNQPTMGNR